MLQELINRSDQHLFAILATGQTLRLLRDASSLARQSYVEFDLDLMFREQLFADFRLLWLTLHATRFTPRTLEAPAPEPAAVSEDDDSDDQAATVAPAGPRPDDCWLEAWRVQAISDGSRARDLLEAGVARAITALGTGFVSHPDNDALRTALADNPDTDQDVRHWLLRTVYRFIVLFVAEDRDLLHADDPSLAGLAGRALYREHFSTDRLRRLAATRNGTRHSDLWEAHQLVTRGLGTDGTPELALPPLAASLYDPDSIGLLAHSRITNRYLLEAIRHLSQVRDRRTGNLTRVDYKNLDSEELGGVYEGLLAYVPRYDPAARTFTLTTAAGSDRKKSGSYYTPSNLIALILDESLDPLIDAALRVPNPEAALLNLTVCDPACGSGHFLVAAARRIAHALATARTGDPEPAAAVLRDAMRDVVARCIYGVDLNDLAIEVAKVALWLEALTPGKPFAFLDHHLKVGNSLLGTTPKLLAGNIPDSAFVVLDGDDKPHTAKLKSRNKAERQHADRQAAGQLTFDIIGTLDISTVDIAKRAHALDDGASDSIADIRARADAWRRLDADPELRNARLVHDAWCTAFVQAKTPAAGRGLTYAIIQQIRQDANLVSPQTMALIENAARQYRFFHWHLEFPGVFTVPDPGASDINSVTGWQGGFSCMVGNPPWERIKIQEKEYFRAAGRDDIGDAPTASIRGRLIANLEHEDASLLRLYTIAQRVATATAHFLSKSGYAPFSGRGDINVAYVFVESMRRVLHQEGRVGVLVPTGLATDSTMQDFFGNLISTRTMVSLRDFRNAGFFGDVASAQGVRFCALALSGSANPARVEYVFRAKSVAESRDPARCFGLSADELNRLNPNTGTLPIFLSRWDADITLGVYARHPVLFRDHGDEANPWGLSFMRMFDMANDSGIFVPANELIQAADGTRADHNRKPCLPLYEPKMLHHFQHRHGDYALAKIMVGREVRAIPTPAAISLDDPYFEVTSRHYVRKDIVDNRLSGKWDRDWLLGWRDIATNLDFRTLIPCVIPRSGVGHVFPLALLGQPQNAYLLHASWSSLACDYIARQKMSGTHMTYGVLTQLAVPHPGYFSRSAPWQTDTTLAEWIRPYVLELSYTSHQMRPYAEEMGDAGQPFRWSVTRRVLLRAEHDAAFMHIYGYTRSEVEHVLDSFPVMRRYEERDLGEFRTRRLVLDAYDRMAAATERGGEGWVSLLDIAAGAGPRHV
jgi:hypothetical protein